MCMSSRPRPKRRSCSMLGATTTTICVRIVGCRIGRRSNGLNVWPTHVCHVSRLPSGKPGTNPRSQVAKSHFGCTEFAGRVTERRSHILRGESKGAGHFRSLHRIPKKSHVSSRNSQEHTRHTADAIGVATEPK